MRGRGLARLIQGVMKGDPFALGVCGLLVVMAIGWVVYKIKTGPRV